MGSCQSFLRDQNEANRPATIDEVPRTITNIPRGQREDQVNGAAVQSPGPQHPEPSNRSSGARETSQSPSENGEPQENDHMDAAGPSTPQPWKALRRKLLEALHKAEVGGTDKRIILPEDVKTVWAPIATREFYRQRDWYDKSWDEDTTMDGYFRVMSILVYIRFTEWDDFRKLFIDQKRSDEGLPFDSVDLQRDDWLGYEDGQEFFKRQWVFCPDRIEERQDPYDLRGPRHLPWIDEPIEVGKGAYGRVTKRTIAAGYLEYRRGTRNHEKRLVAIKSVPDTNAPKVEFDNLTELRGCLSEHTRIMVNLATMLEYSEHGGTMHHIVYELAAYDLNKFLTLPRHSSRQFRHDSASPERTRSKDMWPGDLIQESRNLADALDFLHNRLYDKWGGSISLSHNDIRPENILVFYPDSKDTWDRYPVGKWKFADFGLSRVKPRKWARNKHLSVDSAATNLLEVDPTHRDELSTSVSNTTPVRDPGRYTAPELDQKIDPLSQIKKKEDGRRADLWSLGCVLSEVITYAVKLDSRRVEVFRKELGEPNLPNRRFYDHLTKDVKIQLLSHLDSLPNVALGDKRSTNDLWIRSSIELVKEIVVKDPRQRLQAGEIRDKLGKIDHSMRHDKEFWLERSLAIDTTHMNGNHSPSPARSNGSATSSPEDMDMESLSQTPSINLFPAGQSKSVPIMKARTSMASMERRRQTSPAELNGGSARSSIMSQVSPKIHRRGRESR